MFINLRISSRNQESVKRFVNYLNVLPIQYLFESFFHFKYVKVPQSKKVFTLLKSPHVHKSAQDQFEYLLFSTNVNLYSFNSSNFLFILKKINSKLFPDVKIKVKFYVSDKNLKQKELNFYKLDKYILKVPLSRRTLFHESYVINGYLQLLDLYGEENF